MTDELTKQSIENSNNVLGLKVQQKYLKEISKRLDDLFKVVDKEAKELFGGQFYQPAFLQIVLDIIRAEVNYTFDKMNEYMKAVNKNAVEQKQPSG